MRPLLTLLCTMTAFGVQASDTAHAIGKGDPTRGQAVASTVCVACHGADGNSPVSANPKEHVNLRLDPDVVAAFRATGRGWQTRLNTALKDWLKDHSPA